MSPSDDDVEPLRSVGESERHVDRRERVQALVAQDLAEVRAERIGRRVTTSTGGGDASVVNDQLTSAASVLPARSATPPAPPLTVAV